MSDKNWNDKKEQLLEGLDGSERTLTSVLLDNAKKEISKLYETAGAETSHTSNFARYDRLFMPLIRRVTPALLSMDLVGNQPLDGPTGLVRTIRHMYAENVAAGGGSTSVTAGDEADGQNIYEKYSLIASGEAYDASDARTEDQITNALEAQGGYSMNTEVVNQTVTATTRKLQANWTIEADQDSKSLDGLDLESELVSLLSDEITRELDRELLGELNNLAGITDSFDFALADGRYAGEKFTGLTVGFSDLSNRISKSIFRGGATWMVCTTNVMTALRNASNNSFTPATSSGDFTPRDTLFVGTFNGSIRVYVDLYASSDYVLMGYKGSSELDTGFVYCPYVPIMSSGVVRDPVSFDPRLSLMTRYAFAKFTDTATSLANSPDFYARATLSNLQLGFK